MANSDLPNLPGYMTDATAELQWAERCERHGGERHELGSSHQGRPIYGYRFHRSVSNDAHDGRSVPVVFLLSLVHPMEWIGRELHLALLDQLLSESGPIEILSLPNANPDGTARVEAALRSGRPAWVRGNADGIDLNRNFPVSFRRRSKLIDWWPMWRPGPAPASEPETKAVLEFVRGRKIQLSLTLHSFGRWIFYPPGGQNRPDTITDAHGRLVADALRTGNPLQYQSALLAAWSWWFRAYGIEIDTLREQNGGWTYLVELGRSSFARWGFRELAQPFFVFNPRIPQREIDGVLPLLTRLARAALTTPRPGSAPDSKA